jgi:hypothetical protein
MRERDSADLRWNKLGFQIVAKSERGPTIGSRFLALINVSLSDVRALVLGKEARLALFDELESLPVFRRTSFAVSSASIVAYVASNILHRLVKVVGLKMIKNKYLENEWDIAEGTEPGAGVKAKTGSDPSAAVLRSDVLAQSRQIRDEQWQVIRADLPQKQKRILNRFSNEVADLLLDSFTQDGSRQNKDYDGRNAYAIQHWVEDRETGPLVTRPTAADGSAIGNQAIDFNFYQDNWIFNDFEPRKALRSLGDSFEVNEKGELAAFSEPLKVAVNPAVASGNTRLTASWQSISDVGIFPTIDDGGTQVPLTAHWKEVRTYVPSARNMFRLNDVVTPYLPDGSLNPEFVDQARDLVELSESLQSRFAGSSKRKAIAEYWELGDGTFYPPGYWQNVVVGVAESDGFSLSSSQANGLLLAASTALHDAAVIAWSIKYELDTVRPFLAINQLFYGSRTPDWRGDQLAQVDDRAGWRPYQLRRNYTPPFPDYISGHSIFSAAASAVLRCMLEGNAFDAKSPEFGSRFDLEAGFDGRLENGNESISLSWSYHSERAEEAGFSRMLGGIHTEAGNVEGLKLGIQLGHRACIQAKLLFEGKKNDKRLAREIRKRVPAFGFGTLDDDVLAVSSTKTTELYGFGGSDTLIASEAMVEKGGAIGLFGGFDDDRFVVSAADAKRACFIRDFEKGDSIVLAGARLAGVNMDGLFVASRVNANGVAFTDLFYNETFLVGLDGRHESAAVLGAIVLE